MPPLHPVDAYVQAQPSATQGHLALLRATLAEVLPTAEQEPTMQTFTANQAKTHFGEFLDLAQREPVRVMRFANRAPLLYMSGACASRSRRSGGRPSAG